MNEDQLNIGGSFFSLFNFEKVIMILFGITVLILLAKAVIYFADRITKYYPSRRLLVAQIKTVINFCLYIFGTFVLFFGILKPPQALMIAAGGSVAVALGLSLKDLVASIVAGLILLFDRPFQVGDRVTFGDIYGEIKSIGLRAVQLVTLDDSLVTIPNSRFLTDSVSSGNSGALDMLIQSDFFIDLEQDVQLVRDILFDTVVTSQYVYLNKPVAIVVSEEVVASRIAVRLRLKAYVLDVRFEKAFQTDVYIRANAAFKKNNIRRPRFGVEMTAL